MSARVAATNDDEVKRFVEEAAVPTLTKEDINKLYDVLTSMTKALGDIKDKIKPEVAVEEKTETLTQRWYDNQIRDMFVGKQVTSEETDNVVGTLTLVCALILTIPYGVMSAAGPSYWDNVETVLDACPVQKYTYDQDFQLFSKGFNTVIYSNISVLIMAVLYYLLRPKSDEKFRKWWKNARYSIIMMMLGTVCSIVCLVIVSAWMFSWYLIPNSKLCTYSAKTDVIAGIVVIVVCFGIGLFNML